MAMTEEMTSLICLFHHRDHASAATQDLLSQGISRESIKQIDSKGPSNETGTTLDELGLPARDRQHLLESLNDGGIIVAVLAGSGEVATVEKVFGKHKAEKIDEAEVTPNASARASETSIPIVEEELAVGKRTVDQGGVRLYRRVVEIPVEESVNLRDEHVIVERHAINRPVTDSDLALQGDRTIELTETAEEAVVSKTAHVVEEVVVGKTTTQHSEHIHDTVRHTEVELEEVLPTKTGSTPRTI